MEDGENGTFLGTPAMVPENSRVVGLRDRVADHTMRGLTWAGLASRELIRGSLAVAGLYKIPEWAFWFGNDVGRFLRYGDQSQLYGIRAYCGLFGKGKTISMVEWAYRQKRKYKDKIKIYANCPVAFADGPIRGYKHMVDCWQEPVNHLFLFDEIHLSWEQQEWKNVDPEVLTALTQMRKWGEGGFAVAYTTQRLIQTAIIWRRLAESIVDCEGWPTARWIHQKAYAGVEEYNEGMPRRNPISGDDMRNVDWQYSFIADDFLRGQYDTRWVAKRLTRDGEAGIIGEDAVKAKIARDATHVTSMLEARNAADRAVIGATAHPPPKQKR